MISSLINIDYNYARFQIMIKAIIMQEVQVIICLKCVHTDAMAVSMMFIILQNLTALS